MKRLVLIFALIWGNVATASDPAPSWGFWQAHVYNTYCELSREYYIPFRNDPSRSDPSRRGFLSGTAFDRAIVQFRANTQLHGESLGVIRFSLVVYPEDMPAAPAISERIIEASLGGYRSEAILLTTAEIQGFLLSADESAQLLQRFTDNEVVEFELKFATGDVKQFKIYPSGNRTFYVWADMFHTCIKSHKGKKR